jgi:hypothetical protein
MLTRLRIESLVKVADQVSISWSTTVVLAMDCFICRRAHRSHILEAGQPAGRCASGQRAGEETPTGVYSFSDTSLTHPAPVRITGFHQSTYRAAGHREAHRLRCDVDYWWAPFEDLRSGKPGQRFPAHPWVRLGLGAGCRACFDRGDKDALRTPGKREFQTNQSCPLVWSCPTCERDLATVESPPEVTLSSAVLH